MSQDLIIIGAGITGLTAAYEAQRRGLRPLVLEASARAGGLVQTDHWLIEAKCMTSPTRCSRRSVTRSN